MDNMKIYEQLRSCPKEAQKVITGGRLNGMTDINPMWRIKKLTETFGPAGTGWWTQNIKYTVLPGADGEQAVMCELQLMVLADGKPSAPVYGVGGSMLIVKERSGLRTSDEAYKMAYTDALSVACKALGMAADIYFANDKTKYSASGIQNPTASISTGEQQKISSVAPKDSTVFCSECHREVKPAVIGGKEYPASDVLKQANKKYGKALCYECLCKYNDERRSQ